jgi:hypothetical protein
MDVLLQLMVEEAFPYMSGPLVSGGSDTPTEALYYTQQRSDNVGIFCVQPKGSMFSDDSPRFVFVWDPRTMPKIPETQKRSMIDTELYLNRFNTVGQKSLALTMYKHYSMFWSGDSWVCEGEALMTFLRESTDFTEDLSEDIDDPQLGSSDDIDEPYSFKEVQFGSNDDLDEPSETYIVSPDELDRVLKALKGL